MELNVTGCDKGDGLRHLCEKLGIPLADVFAMGDNGNDLTMLRTAGVSAAMKNGTEEAKKAATFCDPLPLRGRRRGPLFGRNSALVH